jgi:hypothetical protein
MSMGHWWNDTDRRKPVGGKPVPMPLCPPEILHGPAWDLHQDCAVRNRWLDVLSHGTAFRLALYEARAGA